MGSHVETERDSPYTIYMETRGYVLLDFGNGQRLEDWGPHRLIRPDPTAPGEPEDPSQWNSAVALYEGEKGKGIWKKLKELPEQWPVQFGDLSLLVQLAPYKHTGVFPEQQQNWNWMRDLARGKSLSILNLFAYTGGASIALAKDGHFVTHVDAAKPSVNWAKENAKQNQIPDDRIRWIVDDATTFVAREKKRVKLYDAIIIDPPAYGHSPSGKTWRVERDLAPLLEQCVELLTPKPAFLLLNGYAQNDSPESFHRLLRGIFHTKRPGKKFSIDASELVLRAPDGRTLSTGTVARAKFE